MNQDNNFNQNDFNSQGNNGIPNNQPLPNNQNINNTYTQQTQMNSTNMYQQPVQPQDTFNNQAINTQPNYQQSINQINMQQTTSQPMSTFESGNISNQSFDSKPPKKMNLGFIIGIVVIVLVIVAIIIIFKFIGNDKNNSNNNSLNNNENSQTSTKYERDSELPGTVEVNLTEVKYCMDSPSKQVYNRGEMYSKGHNDSYLVIYDNYKDPSSKLNYDVDLSKITKPSEIINGMKKQFINSISDYLNNASDYEYKITNENEMTINGYNMYRFEGELELLYEIENPAVDYTKAQFVGYSTIKDGTPMYFVVVQKPNEKNQINLGDMADKIVKTLREYDGNCYDD